MQTEVVLPWVTKCTDDNSQGRLIHECNKVNFSKVNYTRLKALFKLKMNSKKIKATEWGTQSCNVQ